MPSHVEPDSETRMFENHGNTELQENITKQTAPDWVEKARSLAMAYISAWRKNGCEPTLQDVAFFVEREFSSQQILSVRGNLLERDYIKRFALVGITDRPRRFKCRMPRVPNELRGTIPKHGNRISM